MSELTLRPEKSTIPFFVMLQHHKKRAPCIAAWNRDAFVTPFFRRHSVRQFFFEQNTQNASKHGRTDVIRESDKKVHRREPNMLKKGIYIISPILIAKSLLSYYSKSNWVYIVQLNIDINIYYNYVLNSFN